MTRQTQKQKTKPLGFKEVGFDRELSKALQGQYERVVKKRFASMIIIDGGVGQGKTTLAIKCADVINYYAGKPPLDLETCDQLAMGGEEFMAKLLTCHNKKLPVVIYDEAGDFNRRGALSRFNAGLNRTFETFRGFQVIVILVLPSFSVLDNSIFDKNIPRLLIHCHGRKTYGHGKAYSLPKMLFIRRQMEKLAIKSLAYGNQTPNFHITYKDLEASRSKQLDKVSTASKIKELESQYKKVNNDLMSISDIAKHYSRTTSWASQRIKALGLSPESEVGRKKFFSREDVEKIA